MGVAPTLPGIPDSASTPTKPRSTANATKGSHGSPAATVTVAPEHMSSSTATPRVRTRTTVPSNPRSATTRLLPPATRSSGVSVASASRTASTSADSVSACSSRPAGPPTRSVVRSASNCAAPSGTQHRLGHAEHLLSPAGDLERDLDPLIGDVLDGAPDHDLDAGVVVRNDHWLGELATDLTHPTRRTGPGVERPGRQRQREHAVRDHPRQTDRGGHAIRPVDRVEVAARPGVAHQRGPGDGVGLFGKLLPARQVHGSSPRCTRVANAVQTGRPSASVISLRVPMMSAPPICRRLSTVKVAVRMSPATTGRV